MMRPLVLKFVGFLIALAIQPPVIILGLLTKGWTKFFEAKERLLPPSMLQDPKWGTHQYVHLPGLKMHYVEKGDKSKPLMIFVHGFPAFWFSWRHQLTYFYNDFWCVAVDLRGYGGTEKPTGIDAYDVNLLADDIANLAKALGRSNFILVGHDWGGAVGYQVCARHSKMVTKFIACNIPHGKAFERAMHNGWAQILKSWYLFFFQCPIIPEMFLQWGDFQIFDSCFKSMKVDMAAAKEEIECYKFTFRDSGSFAGPLNYYRHILQYGSPNQDRIRRVPVLQIWGTADSALDIACAKGTRDFVDNFEEEYLEGVSHWVQMEEPNKVNQAIEKFVKR